jgi:broad-specificity NMP kinase
MIIIITGAPGSGKTKTAELLNKTILNSAWIDGDCALGVNPQIRSDAEVDIRYSNIASMVKNYKAASYEHVFISFVYPNNQWLEEQIEKFDSVDTVKVFGLITKNEVLKARHKQDTYTREDIDSSIELNDQIRNIANIQIIDNSDLTLDQVSERIQEEIL